MLIGGAVLTAAVTCLMRVRTTIATHWKLWQSLHSWQAASSFSTLRRRMLACRTPYRSGWWGIINVLQVLANTKRERACLVKEVLKAREEHEAFTRKFLTVVLSLLFCLHVAAVLLLWWQWSCCQAKAALQDADRRAESAKKPLLKRQEKKWRKKPLSGKLQRQKNNPLKRKLKYLKTRIGKTKLEASISTADDDFMQDLDRYLMATRGRPHGMLPRDVVGEGVHAFWLMAVKTLRGKLRLGEKMKEPEKTFNAE